LLAGARYWYIKAGVAVPPVLDIQSTSSFVDPIVGVRWHYDIAPRWSVLAYGDVGGFGIGSDTTWQMMGAVNYQVKDTMYLSLGYRYLSVDYRHNGKRLDFQQQGAMIGATFQF
jgi:opacity protein-like surface antigen